MAQPPMELKDHYTGKYYDHFQDSSRRSAGAVLPVVIEQLSAGSPTSVIDFGCGLGAWLAAWRDAGVREVQGVDGPWVDSARLLIPPSSFRVHDLFAPFTPVRRYDVAMSVETAEHLPESAAAPLVAALVASAPVVLFSAAIPHCRGEHHVNCQWPKYWAELFARHGYSCVDSLRTTIWNDERVDWWYKNGLMLYVDDPRRLKDAHVTPEPLPLVHPLMVDDIVAWGVEQNAKYWQLYKQTKDSRAAK